MSEILKRFIEGFEEGNLEEEKDYWSDVIRAAQNKLVVQADLEAIEDHFGLPCAVVYIGFIKGIIPVHEFGITKDDCVRNQEDTKDKKKLDNSYKFMRSLSGQKVAFIVRGVDKKNNLFTASRKDAIEWMRNKTLETLEQGITTTAVIRNVNPFRALADIGGVIAVLPASEYQHGWTDDLGEQLQVGKALKVKVIEFDKEKGRAVISRKELTPDPWENIDVTKEGEYSAVVTGVREDGAYFRINTKNGQVQGFMKHPRHAEYQKGDKVLVRILNIDSERRFIFGLFIRPIDVA